MQLRSYSIYFLISISVYSFQIFSQQTREKLEQENNENIIKIKEGQKIINETEIVKRATLGKLNAVRRQINSRVMFILNLRKEIIIYGEEIDDLNHIINSLIRDLYELKIEYGEMIYSSYKSNSSLKKITFIFSSSTYNQFFRRIEYLSQYSEVRKNQATQIFNVSENLENQKQRLIDKTKKQNDVLNQQVGESVNLENLKQKQNKIVTELNQKQRRLRKELESRKNALKELDKLIAEVIRKENEKKSGDNVRISTEDRNLTEAFEKNIGKMDWPVLSGFISNKFGEHTHPVIKNIKVSRNL